MRCRPLCFFALFAVLVAFVAVAILASRPIPNDIPPGVTSAAESVDGPTSVPFRDAARGMILSQGDQNLPKSPPDRVLAAAATHRHYQLAGSPRQRVAMMHDIFGFASLDSLRDGEIFTLSLFPDLLLRVAVRSNTPLSPDGANRVLVARINDSPHGRVIISRHQDTIYTSVHAAPGGDYEVRTDADGRTVVSTINAVDRLPCATDTVTASDADGLHDVVETRSTTGALSEVDPKPFAMAAVPPNTTVQDVLILFNNQARVVLGGNPGVPTSDSAIRAKIQAAVAAANTAYVDSNVPLVLRAVAILPIDYFYPVAENFARALLELRTPDDSRIDEIHDLRDTYGADIVSLWLENSVTGGLANVNTAASLPNAFNLVRAQNPIDTFVHEVGHNQGNRHLAESYPSRPSSWFPDSFAHSFTSGGKNYVTIMASTDDAAARNATRLLRFSAPELTYVGQPTGVVGFTNAAATLRANREIIAAFRPTIVDLQLPIPAAPSLSLNGGTRIITRRASLTLRGTARGVERITCQATGSPGTLTATGNERWAFRIFLRARRTTVTLRAFDSYGVEVQRVRSLIVRRPRGR